MSAIATGSPSIGSGILTHKDKRQKIDSLSFDPSSNEIHSHIDEHRKSQKKVNLDVPLTQPQRATLMRPPWINTKSNTDSERIIHKNSAEVKNFHGLEHVRNLSDEQKDASEWVNSIGTSKSQIFEPSKSNGTDKSNGSSNSSSSSSSLSSITLQQGLSSSTLQNKENCANINAEEKLDDKAKASSIEIDGDTMCTLQHIFPSEVVSETVTLSTYAPSVVVSPLGSSCKPNLIGLLSSDKGLLVVGFLLYYMLYEHQYCLVKLQLSLTKIIIIGKNANHHLIIDNCSTVKYKVQ